jgi:hypothetical protein
MDSETKSEPAQDAELPPEIETTAASSRSLTQRIAALETSVYRLRLTLYCAAAVVLLFGVLAGGWLFKQIVRRLDEASGSMQTLIEQRANASRHRIEVELGEIRRQIKTIGGEAAPAGDSTSGKDAAQTED